MVCPDYTVVVVVLVATVTGLLTAAWFASRIALISIEEDAGSANARLINNEHKASGEDATSMSVPEIAGAIAEGANAFLYAEYQARAQRRTPDDKARRYAARSTHQRRMPRFADLHSSVLSYVLPCGAVDGCVHVVLRRGPPVVARSDP
jgi:hypothetical protein